MARIFPDAMKSFGVADPSRPKGESIMKELPLVSVSRREREDTAIPSTVKPTGYLKPKEEAIQLRSRLLQMILNNERSRRTPPPAPKV